ncbi:hypothetical protein L7F22_057275 [Adiantum nelumboides]|nr:hypothetical protein [Adiantum nelumboides]
MESIINNRESLLDKASEGGARVNDGTTYITIGGDVEGRGREEAAAINTDADHVDVVKLGKEGGAVVLDHGDVVEGDVGSERGCEIAGDFSRVDSIGLHDVEEPLSFYEAQNSKNWMATMQSKFDALIENDTWMAAMQSEFDALIANDTWTLCDLPPGKKAIGTKWVYKLKHKPDAEIDRYKARLVAKGYAQQKGIDYEETFAPTCRMTTVHFLCALAAHSGRDVNQSDIVTAFLNGDIFEEDYVTQPRGFVKKGHEDKVCKCHKALYGLKQSPRAWYEKADTHLVKRGFRNSPTESTLG